MEKCVYKGEVLYAYQVLQNFDFEQEIRSCHALTCCDCGAPVFFKHGKQRTECFAHYKREDCKYNEYCSKQSNIFKHTQHELYYPLQRIAEKHGFVLEEDIIIIRDHYTAFVLRCDSLKYAIDIIDTATTSATLEKRNRLYEAAGYQYLQITVDKDAESEPFSEREMAYFPVKYALNKSLNHTAIVIDKERKDWFIYILDKMDMSGLPESFYDLADWYDNDAFAMSISLYDLDIDTHGFFTVASSKAYGSFCSYRRSQKENWLKEEPVRRERQRKQAEEARQAEIKRQEFERRLKEEKEKRRQEAERRHAAAEAAKLQATQAAELKRQQQIDDEKSEIAQIHRTTGGYVGSKINGKYEISSLESLTSSRPSRDWLCEYQRSHFMERINEIQEFKQSGIRTLFAKLCYIKPSEISILQEIVSELKNTDSETAGVIEYLMKRARTI